MSRPALVIGILTFRRPAQLAELLALLPAQIDDVADLADASVLVVDNDPDGSAREVVAAAAGVRYVHEPVPGIAAARQRCLDETNAADLLQFIDDDEIPEEGWLRFLVKAWLDYGRPAAVAGSVLPCFSGEPDRWILAGGFFTRRRPPTGTRLRAAPTSNLLIDLNQTRALGVHFDPRLGLRGGEDTLFTSQLAARGGRIIFCRESAVHDLVPADRATRSWVLRRAWHHGATTTHIELLDTTGRGRRAIIRMRRAFGGLARWMLGSVRALIGHLMGDQARHAKGLRLQQRGAGMARAAVGVTGAEYAR